MDTTTLPAFWLPNDGGIDTYGAFRGEFELPVDSCVEIDLFGCHFFKVWLDGDFLCEGPARFEPTHPEYEVIRKRLKPGRHLIAAIVHNEGVSNRLLRGDCVPAFFACRIRCDEWKIPISWNCLKLDGFISQTRRISPCLGWIEWCDTAGNPRQWHLPSFDASGWLSPQTVELSMGPFSPLSSKSVKRIPHPLTSIAEGPLAEVFGYERDDIAARFFLRDLTCRTLPPQGLWRRYDLGRVRLGCPCFVLDAPAGAEVEFALSESLQHDRVLPWIPLSLGTTCNLDHYVARGGVQTFSPLTPKAGRFLEVHIKTDPAKIRFIDEQFMERCYFDAPTGHFTCSDARLNAVWATGIETLCACAEDAVVDTPYRERGQWIGDSLTVGMEIAAATFSDLSLFERTLRQSAWSADARGLVAGMCSGECIYLPAYSLQWVTANLRYFELTGRRELLAELYPYALKNMAVFESITQESGLSNVLGGNFIDWGYALEGDGTDMAYNLHYLKALRDMIRWCRILGTDETAKFERLENCQAAVIETWFTRKLAANKGDWAKVGYHVTALALRAEIIKEHQKSDVVESLKHHLTACFPNNPDAPRLSDPAMQSPQIITPYFAHFVLPVLIEAGQMTFVQEQYRSCWGWALDQGCTTWPEVFDLRWSHSHHWSGCPTWQLSRYVLGLHPRFDRGQNHYEFRFFPGELASARGTIPVPRSTARIEVEWTRSPTEIEYIVEPNEPILLYPVTPLSAAPAEAVEVKGRRKFLLPIRT